MNICFDETLFPENEVFVMAAACNCFIDLVCGERSPSSTGERSYDPITWGRFF